MAPTDGVTLEKRGKVAIITLNRERKLNAMGADDYFRLATIMQEVAEMPDIYITVLTGKGRFFSAGADVGSTRPAASGNESPRRALLQNFASNNLNITHAFYSHPKILITAMNGPAVGLSAALISFSDFIYAMPHSFLLTPFSSIGLVAEGNASIGFVQRLGLAKANEALIMSKRITCDELVQTGFVNKVFDTGKDYKKFLEAVLNEIDERLGDHLNQSSLLKIKALIRQPYKDALDRQGVLEVLGGVERFMSGEPQRAFAQLASGEKKHKL